MTQESILKRALERKRSGYAHKFFFNEKILILALERGDLELLHKHIQMQISWPAPTRMSKEDQVLHDRSNAVRHIDDGVRIAIKRNVDYETACFLGEIMMNDINRLSSRKDIANYVGAAMELFIKQMAEAQKESCSIRTEWCIQYIDQHIYEKISVEQIAAWQKVNPDYLSRLFKKETGCTLSSFIGERKIREAKLMLSYTSYSICDISTMLSFKHMSHFSKMFKQYSGMTPSMYISQHRSYPEKP